MALVCFYDAHQYDAKKMEATETATSVNVPPFDVRYLILKDGEFCSSGKILSVLRREGSEA